MGQTRDWFEPWLRDYLRPRYPELEATLVRAIEAYEMIHQTGRATPELLAPIVAAASSPRRLVLNNAVPLLSRLIGPFAEARDAVASMAQDSRCHVRFNAMACLDISAPPALALPLLRQGLQDRSARVREKAACQASRLRIRELIPDLEQAESRERNVPTKESITFSLKLLRDGYILKPDSEGGFWITIPTNNGGFRGRWIAREELLRLGLEAIIANLAKVEY